MLIECVECGNNISDKAIACPHCGYPIVTREPQKRRHRQNRRKRLPNGFGQITKIADENLRKPYRVMVTVGKTEEGRPISKILKPQGYFETYNEAYAALLKYNQNPYDLASDTTMQELYERWSAEHFEKISAGSAKNIRCAWSHCGAIREMPVREVRARHMKTMIESSDVSKNNRVLMKMILNMMLDYAVEYELVEQNCARNFSIEKHDRSKETGTGAHITFTDGELQTILSNEGKNKWVDMIIVECFMGWRPNEVCAIRNENIDLTDHSITGGSKTEAGSNRKVPIHSGIIDIVLKYKSNAEYLFGNLTYNQYLYAFGRTLKELGIHKKHQPHDCRVTFVTMAKKYNVDEYAIKKIVGHAITDLTERVYTKRDFSWLREEIEKIEKGM